MKNTIKIAGYGSLVSKASALETVPTLKNFKLGYVQGYKRIFNKVGIVFFRRGYVKADDKDLSSCATRVSPEHKIRVCTFDCPENDFQELYEREHRFRWIEVQVQNDDGTTEVARMCTENTDENYRLNKCVLPSTYQEYVGQYYSGRIWRDDILPNRRYLAFCINAFAALGEQDREGFLASTFLSDGSTSIKEFLTSNPGYLEDVEEQYRQS